MSGEGAHGNAALFAGRVAVVTGAASGIGAATASRLAAEGAAAKGPILTKTWDRVEAADRQRSVDGTAAGPFGQPSEVAAAIAFIASPDASFITGASLVVDGGWSVAKDSA